MVGLEIFFGSEKVAQQAGSRVQLPRIPEGPLQQLCPVMAYAKYQQMKKHLNPRPSAPWLIDSTAKPMLQPALLNHMDYAIEKVYGNTKYMHFLKKLWGHSFRAALPTHMQNKLDIFSKEERKLMGRWLSDKGFQAYCKDATNNRLNIAQLVLDTL